MIKTFHEAPLQYFDLVQSLTSGDYALVHLFEEIPDYFDKFVQARELGRHVILDNSIFELGVAFDKDKFKEWIALLKPTEYIIPDVLEDAQATVASVKAWDRSELPGTPIGVVQGKTWKELVWCYKEIEPFVDRVAISFDYSYYGSNLLEWTYGRISLVQRLHEENIVQKPIHLLGLATPVALNLYRQFKWVDSIDTSNPVMWGIENGIYPTLLNSITSKPQTKLFTLMEKKFDGREETPITYNIRKFEELFNG